MPRKPHTSRSLLTREIQISRTIVPIAGLVELFAYLGFDVIEQLNRALFR
jgi:hypothetical protein